LYLFNPKSNLGCTKRTSGEKLPRVLLC